MLTFLCVFMQQLTAVMAASQSIRKSQKMKKMLEVSKRFHYQLKPISLLRFDYDMTSIR